MPQYLLAVPQGTKLSDLTEQQQQWLRDRRLEAVGRGFRVPGSTATAGYILVHFTLREMPAAFNNAINQAGLDWTILGVQGVYGDEGTPTFKCRANLLKRFFRKYDESGTAQDVTAADLRNHLVRIPKLMGQSDWEFDE